MGVGAAAMYPSTLALVSQMFPDPRQRKNAIAAWAASSGIAVVIGPLLGGILVEHYWWGSMFLINVPIGIFLVVCGRAVLPESPRERTPFDVPGSVLSIVGVGAAVWALIEGPEYGWTSNRIAVAAAISAAALGAFVLVERRTSAPMLPLGFFRFRQFRGSVIAIAASSSCLFGFVFVASQFLQLVMRYSPLEAGVRYLPFAGAMIAAAAVAPMLVKVLGERGVIAAGLAVTGTGLLLTTTIGATSSYVGTTLVVIMLLGAGSGLTVAVATESLVHPLPADRLGVGSAMNDTSRELGGAIGVALFGSVFSAAYRTGGLAAATTGLPADAAALVRATPTAAMEVAASLGERGESLRVAVNEAIVHGLHRSGVVAGAGCALGIVALRFLWARDRQPVQAAGLVHTTSSSSFAHSIPPAHPTRPRMPEPVASIGELP